MQTNALDERRIITPLNSTFMLTSIIGFLLSAFWVPTLDYRSAVDFSIAFCIVFAAMFIASLLSMTYAPVGGDALQIDEKRRFRL